MNNKLKNNKKINIFLSIVYFTEESKKKLIGIFDGSRLNYQRCRHFYLFTQTFFLLFLALLF